MSADLFWYLLTVVLAFLVASAVFLALRRPMQTLLDHVVTAPGGTTFFLRGLLLTLVLTALAAGVAAHPGREPEAFMERVWRVGEALNDVLDNVAMLLAVYVVIVTILVSALKPRP